MHDHFFTLHIHMLGCFLFAWCNSQYGAAAITAGPAAAERTSHNISTRTADSFGYSLPWCISIVDEQLTNADRCCFLYSYIYIQSACNIQDVWSVMHWFSSWYELRSLKVVWMVVYIFKYVLLVSHVVFIIFICALIYIQYLKNT